MGIERVKAVAVANNDVAAVAGSVVLGKLDGARHNRIDGAVGRSAEVEATVEKGVALRRIKVGQRFEDGFFSGEFS